MKTKKDVGLGFQIKIYNFSDGQRRTGKQEKLVNYLTWNYENVDDKRQQITCNYRIRLKIKIWGNNHLKLSLEKEKRVKR